MSPAVSAPSSLWNWYIDYLWNYDNNSWVATIAYGFRIWAILAILPTIILGLLVSTTVYWHAQPSPRQLTYHFSLSKLGRDVLCHRTHTRRPDRIDLP
jgi:hypothetical protein